MKICPDCHNSFDEGNSHCYSCNWELKLEDSIPVFLSTKDKSDVLFTKYVENYKDISVDDLNLSIQNTDYLLSQNEKLFSYLPLLKGKSVCEVGVGQGLLLDKILKQNPSKLVGIDISLPYLKAIKTKSNNFIETIVANAENIPFSNAFDVIIAADIIEHVLNIGDFLACVNRALKPGGIFVVKTPNNEDINTYSKLRGCKYDFVHLRNFNKQTLKTVLKGAGFEVQKTIYDGFYPYRKRRYITKYQILNRQCDKYCAKNFLDDHNVNRINNVLGNLLFNPIEITMVSQKKMDCLV